MAAECCECSGPITGLCPECKPQGDDNSYCGTCCGCGYEPATRLPEQDDSPLANILIKELGL